MSAECIHNQEGPLDHAYEFTCCDEVLRTRHGERFRHCPWCGERVHQVDVPGMRWL